MNDWTTILTHLGEHEQQPYHPIVPPIVQSSNFAYHRVQDFRAAFLEEQQHHLYTRGNNPTTAILRKKLAALEGAEDALVLSSGSAAIAVAVLGQVAAGDHVICVQKPYAWTYKLLANFLPRFGVETTFVDGRSMNAIQAAQQPNTKLLFLESPNSLTYELQDLEACAQWAQSAGITTIIDNSYCSPIYQNPIAYGIDLVVHSGTKYLGGHSDVVFGAICGKQAMIERLFESEFMTLGTCLSPHDAWLVLRSLRTLPLRMERCFETAQQVVAFLRKHPKVEKVWYPWDDSFEQYDLAQRQMRGAGGLFSVQYKAERLTDMEAFCDRLSRVFPMAVSWGGHESLQVPTCVFYDMPDREAPPLPYTFVRYYVGLESAEFLIRALDEALLLLL